MSKSRRSRSQFKTVGGFEWSLRSLQHRIQRAPISEQKRIADELLKIRERIDQLGQTVVVSDGNDQSRIRNQIKALGDRWLDENREPTEEELNLFRALKAKIVK